MYWKVGYNHPVVHTQNTLAILVGGRSQRMGQDKGLMSVGGSLHVILRAVSPKNPISSGLFQEILVVCSSERQKENYEGVLHGQARVIVDCSGEDRAAVYGIQAALKHATYDRVVIIPVDQVGVDRLILKKLINAPSLPSAFEEFPFPSVWTKDHAQFMTDNKSVRKLLKSFPTLHLITPTPIEQKLLSVNLNTPQDVQSFFGTELKDSYGRKLHYLRLSLTEACNMACVYCLPRGFPGWQEAKHYLSCNHAIKILAAFRKFGFSKVRFTGGEPTLHSRALEIISKAREHGYKTISLTTNGSMMSDVHNWVQAGLTHINISVDSLDPKNFEHITQSNTYPKVMTLIDESLKQDISVKLNTVVLREENLKYIPNLIDWAKDRPLTMRFIELMPTSTNHEFFKRNHVSNNEVQKMVSELGYRVSANLSQDEPAGPAVLYDHPEYPARFGFISPLSCHFCSRCNRVRVTAKGKLRLCLFSDEDIQLPLDGSEDELMQVIRQSIEMKPEEHHLQQGQWGNLVHFRQVGG